MAVNRNARRLSIKRGIRNKISGTAERPRLTIFKSNRAIYAQLIDDSKGHTLAQATSFEMGAQSNADVETAKKVGQKIAERAKAGGIETIIFDRSGYRYHGKVKALADGARDGGLKF